MHKKKEVERQRKSSPTNHPIMSNKVLSFMEEEYQMEQYAKRGEEYAE